MSKKKIIRELGDSTSTFAQIKNQIDNKYFNMFIEKFEISVLEYQERNFVLRQFYDVGSIGAIKIENSESEYNPSGDLIFVPYAPNLFNIYDYPVSATAINKRGLSFIPNRPLMVGEEIVLGYIQPNRKGIKEIVNYYSTRIAEVEQTIRTNLFSHKMPFLIAVTPENKQRMETLVNRILEGENKVLVDVSDVESIKVLNANNNYIIDKLKQYSQQLENELRERLGFDNLGTMEKKEHLITSEVEVNNDVINNSNDIYLSSLQSFFDEINKLWGYSISVKLKSEKENDIIEDDKGDNE